MKSKNDVLTHVLGEFKAEYTVMKSTESYAEKNRRHWIQKVNKIKNNCIFKETRKEGRKETLSSAQDGSFLPVKCCRQVLFFSTPHGE